MKIVNLLIQRSDLLQKIRPFYDDLELVKVVTDMFFDSPNLKRIRMFFSMKYKTSINGKSYSIHKC